MIKDLFATKTEAADLLNVDVATVGRWIRSGKLTAEKVGNVVLIKREDLSGLTRSPWGRKSKVRGPKAQPETFGSIE